MDGNRFDEFVRRFGRRTSRRALFGRVAATAAALAVGRKEAAEAYCTYDGGLCPIGCFRGSSCRGCCTGFCGGTGTCARQGCMGSGCTCTVGLSYQCSYGLVCCNPTGAMYGSGVCQYYCPWG
jgi:hypothetical protein